MDTFYNTQEENNESSDFKINTFQLKVEKNTHRFVQYQKMFIFAPSN